MRSYFFLLCAILLSGSARGAFDITPIIATLEPTGPNASSSYSIRNGESTKLPVQISIVHRDPDIDGKEDYKETPDIEDLFQIYPAQVILGPSEKRAVRITWIGDPKPKKELAFRVIAEELPFALEGPNKTNKQAAAVIRLSTKYIGSLYVKPPGAAASLVMTAAPSKSNPSKLELTIENQGTAHRVLNNLKLTVSGAGKEFSYPEKDLVSFAKENILAGKTRRFTLDWPPNIQSGPVKVSFELPKE